MRVAVLLASFNGERFISEQIQSILNQDHKEISIYISDDGSSDRTLKILSDLQSRHPEKIFTRQGPGDGFFRNFYALIMDESISADYYAYCDQDDLWNHKKISVAVSKLDQHNKNHPALYCGPTQIINSYGEFLKNSKTHRINPSFRNALLQSIAGGNTMVFNHTARKLLISACPTSNLAGHDWWTYLVLSGAGGKIIYDTEALVKYRQHENNIRGTNLFFIERVKRVKLLFDGTFTTWLNQNLVQLDAVSSESLTPENKKILRQFTKIIHGHFIERLFALSSLPAFRDSLGATILIYALLLIRV